MTSKVLNYSVLHRLKRLFDPLLEDRVDGAGGDGYDY
jgi:hypothetical protein